MRKMLVVVLALALTLSGCTILRVHKSDIEQGNIITPDMVSQLHPGMSEEKVKEIMGTPMLANTFSGNRIDYVYTFKPGYGNFQEKYVTLIFRNGVLKQINGNMYSEFMR